MQVQKILIVDDSPSDRQFLLEKLAQHGFQCVLAEGGDDAIAKASSELPDLILMDVIMPGRNGYEATREIIRNERTRGIPIFLCTGKNQETDRLWGLRQGARDYITKPIDYRALIAKIAAIA